MTKVADNIKIILEERVEKLAETPDLTLFGEELRRIQRYDSEESPLRWRPTIEYVKANSWDTVNLLRRFGERDFDKDIERLVNVYNLAKVINRECRGKVSLKIPLDEDHIDDLVLSDLQRHGKAKGKINWKEKSYFKIDDLLQGFSLLFGSCDDYDIKHRYPIVNVYGLPDKVIADDDGKKEVLRLGKISLKELEVVAQRRFMYAFATSPAQERDIVRALIKLNKFPTKSTKRDHIIQYKLKEKEMTKLDAPRGASLFYDEAIKFKEKGLFADVKVYELLGDEVPVPDPVVVGFDHFGYRLPLIYWAGDRGLKK